MKLIDLLVQELPKRGGWKFGRNAVYQDWDGELRIDSEHNSSTKIFLPLSEIVRERAKMKSSLPDHAFVTREQYEAMTAASNQVEWNGEGLPKVGCEFEYGTHRSVAKCIAVSYHHVFASKGDPDDENSDYEEFLIDIEDSSFYPVSTEADRKRKGVTAALVAVCSNYNKTDVIHAAGEIYDAIVAHRIDGITTVPTVGQIVRCTEKCSREDAERIVAMLTNGTISE